MKFLLLLMIWACWYALISLLLMSCGFEPSNFISSSISTPVNGDTLTIKTFSTQAGAIGSLTFRGMEYVDSTEHGASLQSASSYDGMGEAYNPTEAGTSYDGPTDSSSSSVLLNLTAIDNTLITFTNMALWEHYNGLTLNNELFSKTVVIGFNGLQNVVQYNVNFYVPQPHTFATFEAVTGYMPANFTEYYAYYLDTNMLVQLPTTGYSGFNSNNVIITATADGKNAMAALSLSPNAVIGSWGNTLFYLNNAKEPTNKWNVVFYETNVQIKTYSYQMLLIVGTMDEVIDSIKKLGR